MPNGQERDDLICPYCGHVSQRGIRVCLGCQASIVYGARDSDFASASFAFLFLVLIVGFPACSVVSFVGMHPGEGRIGAGLFTMFVLPFVIVLLLYQWKARRLRNSVRFFRP